VSESIVAQIQALQRMTVGQLRASWIELYGEPTRSRNRVYLWRRLAWRIQELQLGGLPATAKARILELDPAAFGRPQAKAGFRPDQRVVGTSPGTTCRRDPRLPCPGSIITREYRGQQLRLQVLADGFEFDGVHYDSLSEAARVVTGARWSGPLFWGLRKRTQRT